MLCPKCKKELNYLPWLGQVWECRYCGYRGVLAVENNIGAIQTYKLQKHNAQKFKNNIGAIQTYKLQKHNAQKFKNNIGAAKIAMRKNERKLWKLLKKIPKGRVITYKILAKKLGIHPRTAGLLLNKNKNPCKYPCFKVVKSDGSLGGYSRGLRKKIKLLKKDGVEIKKGKIDLKKYLFGL